MNETNATSLDRAVVEAAQCIHAKDLVEPEALLLMGTGSRTLCAELKRPKTLTLGDVPGVPAAWAHVELTGGLLGPLAVWILDNSPGDPIEDGVRDPHEAGWARGFPCWLAAASGATTGLITAAGTALGKGEARTAPGTIAVLRDHINLSGSSPLTALGETQLGPLFPDQSSLHQPHLRQVALDLAKSIGVPAQAAVAACTLGPAVETAAEARFFGRAGADVSVAELATPLLACAHAGLSLVTLVAVVADAGEAVDVPELVHRSEQLAPAMEDLVTGLASAMHDLAGELESES